MPRDQVRPRPSVERRPANSFQNEFVDSRLTL